MKLTVLLVALALSTGHIGFFGSALAGPLDMPATPAPTTDTSPSASDGRQTVKSRSSKPARASSVGLAKRHVVSASTARALIGPAIKCAKAKSCREAAKRKVKDTFDDAVRKIDTAVGLITDVYSALGDGAKATGEGFKRARHQRQKLRRIDDVHRLHAVHERAVADRQ